MDSIDLQVLKEAVEVLDDNKGDFTEEARNALSKVIADWEHE